MPTLLRLLRYLGCVAIAATGLCVTLRGSANASFDHLSLNVDDPTKAAAWYAAHLQGMSDGNTGVTIDGVRLSFRRAANMQGSAGSVIDHLGISVADVGAVAGALRSAGAHDVSSPGAGSAMLDDPWGVRLELVPAAGGVHFHHVHLIATSPKATLDWIEHAFGGDQTQVLGRDGLKFGTLSILADATDRAPTPTAGHVIDHLGWGTPDLETAAATLKAAGVTFTTEPRAIGAVRAAFVEGPDRLRVEVVQR
jgi:catechol 2,3-dioxygenase-like lactoylglutathione lyase family enzyme